MGEESREGCAVALSHSHETLFCRRCGEEGGSRLADSRRLSELREEVSQLRQSLAELVQEKRVVAATMTQVAESRTRVSLRQRAYEESKQRLKTEYKALQELMCSNQRKEERLGRVRDRDFSQRLEKIQRDREEQGREVAEKRARLQETRKELVVSLQTSVFSIQVDPLSMDDAGEEDYQQSAVINCDAEVDVDDGWLLSGVHQSPTPQASIITASLPLNGDYSHYIEASEERRKRLKAASETGAPLPPVTTPGLHPLYQPYLAVPAGLQFIAQLLELVADLLDTPLPHPLHRPLSILEYSSQNKRKRHFLDSLAKIDDNIIYLCFSQNVPLSALSAGHAMSNLMALVTHSELGRQEAFQCDPSLATYRGDAAVLGDSENEPPSLYTADQLSREGSDSGTEPVAEEEGEEEWASVVGPRGRERGQVAGYSSGYLDFVGMGTSSQAGGGQEVGSGEETKTAGLFGTISNIFSSTFASRTTNS